jgi:hypothetical protein
MVRRISVHLARYLNPEAGQDLVEYALVTIVLSATIIAVIAATGLVPAFGVWADDLANCVGSSNPLDC